MRIKNNTMILIIIVLIVTPIIVFAGDKDGGSGFVFTRSLWKDTTSAPNELATITVSGDSVSLPVSDDDKTQLVLQIGKNTSGICECDSGSVTTYLCFNGEHAVCNGDNCNCRSSSYCSAGIEPLTDSCAGTEIYDPDYGTASYDYNACCLVLSRDDDDDDDDIECECSGSDVCVNGSCVDYCESIGCDKGPGGCLCESEPEDPYDCDPYIDLNCPI